MVTAVAVTLCGAISASGADHASPKPPPLSVAAEFVDAPEPVIQFRLRTSEPYTMYEADLPWGNFYSVRLSFSDSRGKTVCERLTAPVDDPSDTEVRLVPGETASGVVLLAAHCPALSQVRSRGRVSVDWNYTGVVRRLGGKHFKGRLVVPAKR